MGKAELNILTIIKKVRRFVKISMNLLIFRKTHSENKSYPNPPFAVAI